MRDRQGLRPRPHVAGGGPRSWLRVTGRQEDRRPLLAAPRTSSCAPPAILAANPPGEAYAREPPRRHPPSHNAPAPDCHSRPLELQPRPERPPRPAAPPCRAPHAVPEPCALTPHGPSLPARGRSSTSAEPASTLLEPWSPPRPAAAGRPHAAHQPAVRRFPLPNSALLCF